MKARSLALLLGVASVCALEGEAETVSLKTAQTEIDFCVREGRWYLDRYGRRLADSSDAEAVRWRQTGAEQNDFGWRRAATLSVFGATVQPNGYRTGENRFGGLTATHADGTLTTELVADGFERIVEQRSGAEHIVLKMRDEVYPFRVRQHFRALCDCDVVETWLEISHDESEAVRLVKMDSAALVFPLSAERYWVTYLQGQWIHEGGLAEAEIGTGSTVSLGSRSGTRGSWGNNPAFMVSFGEPATERSGRVFGGALCWSGAWEAELEHDHVHTLEIRAGAATFSGAYVLDPGRTLETPKFAFTWSERGKGQVSRNFHRWARNWRLPNGRRERAIVFNAWEGTGFGFTEKILSDMMDGEREVGGELFVLDDGWFSSGKYARVDERSGLGDWHENPEKLPHGLRALAEGAAARGLRFGLWIEPEAICTNSFAAEAHPEFILRERTRPLFVSRGGAQVVRDFSLAASRDELLGELDALLAKTPGISYMKWDSNSDFMNFGSANLDAAHQANFWFDCTKGYYAFMRDFRKRHPAIEIQACSSGGGHVDYGNLEFADEFWASDNTDARDRVFIQWGTSLFYPACAMAAHVTMPLRPTSFKFRTDVAMSGRFGFELNPAKLSAEERKTARKAVETYKSIRPVVQQGDLYRLVSPYEANRAVLLYASEDRSRAVLFVYGLVRTGHGDYPAPVVLDGLDPARRYRVTELNGGGRIHSDFVNRTVGGDALMSDGFRFRLFGRDYDSAVFELKAE